MYTPYSRKLFDIRPDGTAATDIEHIVALAEAYDSGLRESQFRTFAGDLANLTIADPSVTGTRNLIETPPNGGRRETPAGSRPRSWLSSRSTACP